MPAKLHRSRSGSVEDPVKASRDTAAEIPLPGRDSPQEERDHDHPLPMRWLARSGLATMAALSLGLPFVACSEDGTSSPTGLPLETIQLPEGFEISLFAQGVPGARSLTLSPEGIVYVGSRSGGRVYALPDRDANGVADQVVVIASGLNSPNGVAWREGDLFVAEISRILRFPAIDTKLEAPPQPIVVRAEFPTDGHHGWKFIAFGPDDRLYIPVGAPCNVCLRDDPRYASIMRMNVDGTNVEVFASGVRNTVGFDWDPTDGSLWFTDNGRDWLGDDAPPDELNRADAAGMHFGFPYCHGGTILDPELGTGHSCEAYIPPVRQLGAHVASLGMRFYDGEQFPAEYRGQIFIAEHGSWNRSTPDGYRVTLVKREGTDVTSYEPFATGWLQGGEVWGRPVDVLVLEDGSLLVSDDLAGVVYRITYAGAAK